MRVDLIEKDGSWNLVAHTRNGLAHDCGFKLRATAVLFALTFYGVKL